MSSKTLLHLPIDLFGPAVAFAGRAIVGVVEGAHAAKALVGLGGRPQAVIPLAILNAHG